MAYVIFSWLKELLIECLRTNTVFKSVENRADIETGIRQSLSYFLLTRSNCQPSSDIWSLQFSSIGITVSYYLCEDLRVMKVTTKIIIYLLIRIAGPNSGAWKMFFWMNSILQGTPKCRVALKLFRATTTCSTNCFIEIFSCKQIIRYASVYIVAHDWLQYNDNSKKSADTLTVSLHGYQSKLLWFTITLFCTTSFSIYRSIWVKSKRFNTLLSLMMESNDLSLDHNYYRFQ